MEDKQKNIQSVSSSNLGTSRDINQQFPKIKSPQSHSKIANSKHRIAKQLLDIQSQSIMKQNQQSLKQQIDNIERVSSMTSLGNFYNHNDRKSILERKQMEQSITSNQNIQINKTSQTIKSETDIDPTNISFLKQQQELKYLNSIKKHHLSDTFNVNKDFSKSFYNSGNKNFYSHRQNNSTISNISNLKKVDKTFNQKNSQYYNVNNSIKEDNKEHDFKNESNIISLKSLEDVKFFRSQEKDKPNLYKKMMSVSKEGTEPKYETNLGYLKVNHHVKKSLNLVQRTSKQFLVDPIHNTNLEIFQPPTLADQSIQQNANQNTKNSIQFDEENLKSPNEQMNSQQSEMNKFFKIKHNISQNLGFKNASERKDIYLLAKWLDEMVLKIFNKQDQELEEVFDSLDSAYTGCISEIVRQISLDCRDRGSLLDKVWESYQSIVADFFQKLNTKCKQQERNSLKEITRVHRIYRDEMQRSTEKVLQMEDQVELYQNITKKTKLENRYLRKKQKKLEKTLTLYQSQIDEQTYDYQQLMKENTQLKLQIETQQYANFSNFANFEENLNFQNQSIESVEQSDQERKEIQQSQEINDIQQKNKKSIAILNPQELERQYQKFQLDIERIRLDIEKQYEVLFEQQLKKIQEQYTQKNVYKKEQIDMIMKIEAEDKLMEEQFYKDSAQLEMEFDNIILQNQKTDTEGLIIMEDQQCETKDIIPQEDKAIQCARMYRHQDFQCQTTPQTQDQQTAVNLAVIKTDNKNLTDHQIRIINNILKKDGMNRFLSKIPTIKFPEQQIKSLSLSVPVQIQKEMEHMKLRTEDIFYGLFSKEDMNQKDAEYIQNYFIRNYDEINRFFLWFWEILNKLVKNSMDYKIIKIESELDLEKQTLLTQINDKTFQRLLEQHKLQIKSNSELKEQIINLQNQVSDRKLSNVNNNLGGKTSKSMLNIFMNKSKQKSNSKITNNKQSLKIPSDINNSNSNNGSRSSIKDVSPDHKMINDKASFDVQNKKNNQQNKSLTSLIQKNIDQKLEKKSSSKNEKEDDLLDNNKLNKSDEQLNEEDQYIINKSKQLFVKHRESTIQRKTENEQEQEQEKQKIQYLNTEMIKEAPEDQNTTDRILKKESFGQDENKIVQNKNKVVQNEIDDDKESDLGKSIKSLKNIKSPKIEINVDNNEQNFNNNNLNSSFEDKDDDLNEEADQLVENIKKKTYESPQMLSLNASPLNRQPIRHRKSHRMSGFYVSPQRGLTGKQDNENQEENMEEKIISQQNLDQDEQQDTFDEQPIELTKNLSQASQQQQLLRKRNSLMPQSLQRFMEGNFAKKFEQQTHQKNKFQEDVFQRSQSIGKDLTKDITNIDFDEEQMRKLHNIEFDQDHKHAINSISSFDDDSDDEFSETESSQSIGSQKQSINLNSEQSKEIQSLINNNKKNSIKKESKRQSQIGQNSSKSQIKSVKKVSENDGSGSDLEKEQDVNADQIIQEQLQKRTNLEDGNFKKKKKKKQKKNDDSNQDSSKINTPRELNRSNTLMKIKQERAKNQSNDFYEEDIENEQIKNNILKNEQMQHSSEDEENQLQEMENQNMNFTILKDISSIKAIKNMWTRTRAYKSSSLHAFKATELLDKVIKEVSKQKNKQVKNLEFKIPKILQIVSSFFVDVLKQMKANPDQKPPIMHLQVYELIFNFYGFGGSADKRYQKLIQACIFYGSEQVNHKPQARISIIAKFLQGIYDEMDFEFILNTIQDLDESENQDGIQLMQKTDENISTSMDKVKECMKKTFSNNPVFKNKKERLLLKKSEKKIFQTKQRIKNKIYVDLDTTLQEFLNMYMIIKKHITEHYEDIFYSQCEQQKQYITNEDFIKFYRYIENDNKKWLEKASNLFKLESDYIEKQDKVSIRLMSLQRFTLLCLDNQIISYEDQEQLLNINPLILLKNLQKKWPDIVREIKLRLIYSGNYTIKEKSQIKRLDELFKYPYKDKKKLYLNKNAIKEKNSDYSSIDSQQEISSSDDNESNYAYSSDDDQHQNLWKTANLRELSFVYIFLQAESKRLIINKYCEELISDNLFTINNVFTKKIDQLDQNKYGRQGKHRQSYRDSHLNNSGNKTNTNSRNSVRNSVRKSKHYQDNILNAQIQNKIDQEN